MVRLKRGEIRRLLERDGRRPSYQTIAAALGCTTSQTYYYVNDEVKNPSLEMVVKWARYLDVAIEDLIEEIEEPEYRV